MKALGLVGWLALALCAGCGRRGVLSPVTVDGRAGAGGLTGNADTGGSSGGGASGSGGAMVASLRSYVVDAKITADPYPAMPAAHTFTLVLDDDRGLAIAGSADGGEGRRFVKQPDGSFTIAGPITFAFPSLSCGTKITYDNLTFTLSDAGLVGTATGRGTYDKNAWAIPVVKASLTGVPDRMAPTLASAPGDDPTDPFLPGSFIASEPLPTESRTTINSSDGAVFGLPAVPLGASGSLAGFTLPTTFIGYDTSYAVQSATLTDFAGNAAKAGPAFRTRPLPPLVAEDGFETTSVGAFSGEAAVVDEPQLVIAGQHSLYLPLEVSSHMSPWTQFAVRLAVKPRDAFVRFSYRTVEPAPMAGAFRIRLAVAASGVAISWLELPDDVSARTELKGVSNVTSYVGATFQAELPLPTASAREIYLSRVISVGCGGVAPPQGLVIDDLRVE